MFSNQKESDSSSESSLDRTDSSSSLSSPGSSDEESQASETETRDKIRKRKRLHLVGIALVVAFVIGGIVSLHQNNPEDPHVSVSEESPSKAITSKLADLLADLDLEIEESELLNPTIDEQDSRSLSRRRIQTMKHLMFEDGPINSPEDVFSLSGEVQAAFAWMIDTNKIEIHQERRSRECLEMVFGCNFANHYRLRDGSGQDVCRTTVVEDSNCFVRNFCCGSKLTSKKLRFFDGYIDKKDRDSAYLKPILELTQPFRCTDANSLIPFFSCCDCCCSQKVQIKDGDGKIIGSIEEMGCTTCWGTGGWRITRGNNNVIAEIEAPVAASCYKMKCGADSEFPVRAVDGEFAGEQIAIIKRPFGDACTTCFTTYDDLSVEILPDVHVPLTDRLLLMGAGLLFKYIYFENEDSNASRGFCKDS